MNNQSKQMKWWGWGAEGTKLDVSDKPGLWPYIQKVLKIGAFKHTPPVKLEDVTLSPADIPTAFLDALQLIVSKDQIKTDHYERVIHSYGKSFRDLWRMRNALIEASPDMVVYPNNENEIAAIIALCDQMNVVLIPFGGGSNIVGSLDAAQAEGRPVVSLDMKEMNQVLEVDEDSMTATIEAGVLGPDMEAQLRKKNVTLGHFPDSFVHSTLGGWVATRSAGMQSDTYGKIEDMVLSVRLVTPQGTIVTRTVPKSASGINMNHLCVGSEGILGVITQVTVQVHHIPACRHPHGYIFPNWESGVAAMRECVALGLVPVVSRLNDPMKTGLSFAYKADSASLIANTLSKLVKWYMFCIRKFDPEKICMMITIFEGTPDFVAHQKKQVHAVYKKHGVLGLGQSPGKSFEKGKYDFPHIRDIVMDRNIMADVSETSTVWRHIMPLYRGTLASITQAMQKTGKQGFVGAHISHTYHTGASLYFTFACEHLEGKELAQYLYIKKAAQDAFMRHHGTLSHHHAVGMEHLPWMQDDISATGIVALQGIKNTLDPHHIMNPGKVIPSEQPFDDWKLPQKTIAEFDAQ